MLNLMIKKQHFSQGSIPESLVKKITTDKVIQRLLKTGL